MTFCDCARRVCVVGTVILLLSCHQSDPHNNDSDTSELPDGTEPEEFETDSGDGKYEWHTYYGGSGEDIAYSMDIDRDGNIVATGISRYEWLGPKAQAPLNSFTGQYSSCVVTKLSANGTYLWHTFYGKLADECRSVGIDDENNIVVFGYAWDTWSGPDGQSPINPHSGYDDPGPSDSDPEEVYPDLFVLKLSPDGEYIWHTFLDMMDHDSGVDVDVDSHGEIVVTGRSGRDSAGPDGQQPLNDHFGDKSSDIIVIKLAQSGAYKWHSYYGGLDFDDSYHVGFDTEANVYLTGVSFSSWDGPNGETPVTPANGESLMKIVVLALAPDGGYLWHTYQGGEHEGWGCAVVADKNGSIYVSGWTYSSWFGPEGQPPLHAPNNSSASDIFVFKLDAKGAYQWHTIYGGMENDCGNSLALDENGELYVTGYSINSWDGPSSTAPLNENAGSDAVLLHLGNDGEYRWHTFYGGEYSDHGFDIQSPRAGEVVVGGRSAHSWIGPTNAPPLHPHSGGFDILVLKASN